MNYNLWCVHKYLPPGFQEKEGKELVCGICKILHLL